MFNRMPDWVRQHVAALRALIVFTVVLGIGYPLVILAVAQIPGLQHRANGSLVHLDGKVVGSAVIGQSFLKPDGSPNPLYFQSRPSDAGDGYDPTATSASNLGPEDIMDTLPDPSVKGDTGTPSLLTQVCTRSHNVGVLEGVDGQRPYCTSAGIGAVLSVIRTHGVTGAVQKVVSVNQECPATPFISTYDGVAVTCATYGVDYRIGRIVVVHGPGEPGSP
jgi:K+-transporting ATPase ATPase C chain